MPTLIRMERGDPGVGIGVYTTALWLLGLSGALGTLASPEKDLRALETDVRAAARTRTVRRQTSITARMGRKQGNP